MAEAVDYALIAVIPLLLGIGYYIFHGRRADERRAVLETKWIYPAIKLVTPYQNVPRVRDALGPYAGELGWTIAEGNSSGASGVEVILAPPKAAISPREYAASQAKIFGVSYAIFRDLVYGGDDEKAKKMLPTSKTIDVLGAKEGEKPRAGDFILHQKFGMLTIVYPLANRIWLERQDAALAGAMFQRPVMADLKAIFGSENVDWMKRSIRADTERRVSEVKDRKSVMKESGELESAEKKILELRMEGEQLERQTEEASAKLRGQIEDAFDLEIA
jgi:hypothetical protein